MKIVTIQAHKWRVPSDFYNALLQSLGAPEWHGHNVNALIDSIIQGDINKIEPPFRVEVSGLGDADAAAVAELAYVFEALRLEGVPVTVTTDTALLEVMAA